MSPRTLQEAPVKVILIAGAGRSGSTLLGRMLGELDGWFFVGELHRFWDNAQRDVHCGCGKRFSECDFWGAVTERTFGSTRNADFAAIEHLRKSVGRIRHIPSLALPSINSRSYRNRLQSYLQMVNKLYSAISEVSGCRVIVDSSKVPSSGFVLNRIPSIPLSIVHLVRDPRAVAFSNQRKKQLVPSQLGQAGDMRMNPPIWVSFEWMKRNAFVELLKRFCRSNILVTYEAFVQSYSEYCGKIAELASEPAPDLEAHGRERLALGPSHSVGGNPMRFDAGPMRIRVDSEWKIRMSSSQKMFVTALTFPLLMWYGCSSATRCAERDDSRHLA